jgi:hypothetical protein
MERILSPFCLSELRLKSKLLQIMVYWIVPYFPSEYIRMFHSVCKTLISSRADIMSLPYSVCLQLFVEFGSVMNISVNIHCILTRVE